MDNWFILLVGDFDGNCLGHASVHVGAGENGTILQIISLDLCQVLQAVGPKDEKALSAWNTWEKHGSVPTCYVYVYVSV